MITQDRGVVTCSRILAADEVADFDRCFIVDNALAATHANDTRIAPGLQMANAGRVANDRTGPRFFTTVAALFFFTSVVLQTSVIGLLRLFKAGRQVLQKLRLIVLDRQGIMSPALSDLGRDLLL